MSRNRSIGAVQSDWVFRDLVRCDSADRVAAGETMLLRRATAEQHKTRWTWVWRKFGGLKFIEIEVCEVLAHMVNKPECSFPEFVSCIIN
jgi:hypothetical protein